MVVMERVECEGAWPEDGCDQVKKAIDTLHEEGLVFGDLRPPNVLVSGGRVFLIDFNWAGKFGEARYPRGLSSQVAWLGPIWYLERNLIEPGHDNFMFRELCSWVKTQKADAGN
jgi:RIO-like serine/threonine protein kinase